jgi:hypothetical protein
LKDNLDTLLRRHREIFFDLGRLGLRKTIEFAEHLLH